MGKTSVALAIGLAAAGRGKRTIVCEVSSQEHASRLFGRAEIGFHEVELRDNLFAISIDPDRSMREYLELQLPVKAMSDLLYRSRIFTYLAAATPGLREMVTIGKIWELALEKRKAHKGKPYDLVVVDAPATGHGIGFMQTPQTFKDIARVGPLAHQAGRINETITDHRTAGAVIVTLPEEMPVNETGLLERELMEGVGVAVDRVYMNGLYPERFSGEELEKVDAARSEEPGGAAAAALSAAADEAARATAQREQLSRLEQLTTTPVETLPFIFSPELGVDELTELSGEIRVGDG